MLGVKIRLLESTFAGLGGALPHHAALYGIATKSADIAISSTLRQFVTLPVFWKCPLIGYLVIIYWSRIYHQKRPFIWCKAETVYLCCHCHDFIRVDLRQAPTTWMIRQAILPPLRHGRVFRAYPCTVCNNSLPHVGRYRPT